MKISNVQKGTFLCLLLGTLLRFIWPLDMEWKPDEQLIFQMAKDINAGQWMWLGMPSGGGVHNPGMSVWVFAFFGLFSSTPEQMVHGVMALNVLALFGFFFLVIKYLPPKDWEIWFLGLALMAVAPLPVIFSRKLWAQDALPFFTFLALWGHFRREKVTGSLLWGAAGASLGQIHMSGFFFAFGIFLATLIHDLKYQKKTLWWPWLVGSTVMALPLFPWFHYMFWGESSSNLSIKNIYKFRYFYFLPIDASGINLRYSLGDGVWDFFKFPRIRGYPTYFCGFLHLLLLGMILPEFKRLPAGLKKAFYALKKNTWPMKNDPLSLLLWGSAIGLGVVMNFAGVGVHEHYLIVCYPLPFIWAAKNFKRIKWIIPCQAVMIMMFLLYIHLNQEVPKGDYGKTYRSQMLK